MKLSITIDYSMSPKNVFKNESCVLVTVFNYSATTVAKVSQLST